MTRLSTSWIILLLSAAMATAAIREATPPTLYAPEIGSTLFIPHVLSLATREEKRQNLPMPASNLAGSALPNPQQAQQILANLAKLAGSIPKGTNKAGSQNLPPIPPIPQSIPNFGNFNPASFGGIGR